MLLYITLFVVFTHLVKAVPSSLISEWLWFVVTFVKPSETAQSLHQVRARLREVRSERAATSSKDQFAKWARLDREHGKLKAESDKLGSLAATQHRKLQRSVRVAKWIATTGIKMVIQWKYRAVPVLWLPKGAVPWIVEWCLALPKAPMGSISVATWITISSTAVSVVQKTSKAVYIHFKPAMPEAQKAQ